MRIVFADRFQALIGAAVLGIVLLSGCAAQSPDTPAPGPDAVQAPAAPSTETPSAVTPAPSASSPTPAAPIATPEVAAPPKAPASNAPAPVERKAERKNDAVADKPPGFDPSNPGRGCKTDSDCEVKNVGSCCGYFPMCVNKNAKTDPDAVRAQCEKSGMASICGFREVKGCQCVQGRCEDLADGAVAM